MKPDDNVCLCYQVSLRKIRSYLAREDPPVASLISECLGAGSGCRWCVPFLEQLHAQHQRGEIPHIDADPDDYREGRVSYRRTGNRDPEREHDANG